MGTPSLICTRNLMPSSVHFGSLPGVEIRSKPCSQALSQSARCANFPRALSLTGFPLPRTRAFPDLPLNRGGHTFLRRRIGEFGCRALADEGLKPEWKLAERVQTDSLPPSVRDSTIRAIDELGRRVTTGDVASRAGLKMTQAESALQALAADSGGFLEVSDDGDVLYVFPKDYRTNITGKSLRLKVEPALNKIQGGAAYLIRISFGTALVASIVLVYSAILILLSSSRGEEDNRGNRGGYGNQRYNSGGMTFFVSPVDLFWFWDPYYHRRARAPTKKGGMNFFESVFSFVFGDGDPNEGLEDRRWKVIGEMIASKGGVVTAEELAPFLDVPSFSDESKTDDSFVLPVLLRFDGYPEVDKEGNILYKFPSLQRTATSWLGQRKESSDDSFYLAERRWNFSKASKMDQALVVGLGGINLLGVIILSSLTRDANIVGQLAGSGIVPFAVKLLPWLQAYTASFFAIPFVRWLLLQRRNTEIEDRNRARIGWAVALQRANKALQQKLTSARELAQRTFIGSDRIIYSSEKDFSDQGYETRDWDERLKKSQSGKG